jgi:hypothetical protein
MTIAGWERLEPPHVTLKSPRGQHRFRWKLREKAFFDDRRTDPSQVPEGILSILHERHEGLCARWNEMYEENPVWDEDDSGE